MQMTEPDVAPWKFRGPWAGLPIMWTEDDRFDEASYRENVARCCRAGVPGIYTGGTTGEFYALEFDEFQAVTRATVEVCRTHGTPVMIGCTSTSTRGAVRRAAFAAELGADAIQVALPFWLPVPTDQIVPFFAEVAQAADSLPLSIYETTRAKVTLTLDQHRAVKSAVPGYAMVKSNAGTIGATPEGCRALSEFLSVFVGEPRWKELAPEGAAGACSAMVYWNPQWVLDLWSHVEQQDWDFVSRANESIALLHQYLASEFAPRGFTDTAYDRMAGLAGGFLTGNLRNRGPYPSATPADVERLRQWFSKHFPEMLTAGN